MKVLFLDFDGVLNSNLYFRWYSGRETRDRNGLTHDEWCKEQIDKNAVDCIDAIFQKTAAKVVISSSWRLLHSLAELARWLKEKGFHGEVIGRTPGRSVVPDSADDDYQTRGFEIAAWLKEHQDVESFVILDDSEDMAHLQRRLIRTSMENGIQWNHVERAITMLTSEIGPSAKVIAKWEADCMKWRGRVLTGEKWHWCGDWDGLPVDESSDEFISCTCWDKQATTT